MKKYIVFACMLLPAIFISASLKAQEPDIHLKKSEEIIIRKNGDETSRMTIEINGDSVMVNGKPLSDYKGGDVTVMQRDFMNRDSHNFLFTPGDGNMNFQDFFNKARNPASKTFLGIMMEKAGEGVKITDVVKESPAKHAGLLNGDIITKVDSKKITYPDDLMNTIKAHSPGDEIKITYLRNNKLSDARVKLGKTKENDNAFHLDTGKPGMNNNGFNKPPVNNMPSLERLYNFNNDNKPKLGIKIQDTEDNSGAKVVSVEDGSAADKAGLKKDDIITTVNDEEVNSVDELKDQLNEAGDQQILAIKAMRNNTEVNFSIKIPKKLNSADL